MYCPSCGAENSLGLNYCNRCGANLSLPATTAGPEVQALSLTKPVLILGLVVTSITLGGIALLVDGAIRLAAVFKQTDPVIALIMLGMLTIFITDIMLTRILSRLIIASLQPNRPTQPKMSIMKERQPAQLGARPEPAASVTEHTTRTFEPVYKKPVEQERR